MEDIEQPERVAQIEREFEERRARLIARRRINPLADNRTLTNDDYYGIDEASAGCVVCHK